jgi:2,4-dienoyl-CoA reductase-like NADH-dependent reductase (Old Yellow Enzyme family)
MSATASTPMILASPLRLPSGAVLKNRVAKGAMSEQIAGRNGAPTSGHERLYERWGASGCRSPDHWKRGPSTARS